MPKIENIALFDMDGTLCDYDAGLLRELRGLVPPGTELPTLPLSEHAPEYVKSLVTLITSRERWWAELPQFKLGWDIWEISKEMGYRPMILTQGPRNKPEAWSGKKRWIDKNLGPDTDITMTRDKGLVYGKILVDDFPRYIARWLEWRERGLVIMPANPSNAEYKHPQVIRYDGTNLGEVQEAMEKAKLREE